MPGYALHQAAGNIQAEMYKEENKIYEFLLGIEAPDIFKAWVKSLGIDGARHKYNDLKTPGMPEFSRFEGRAQEKETVSSDAGMHYGVSSAPNLLKFWDDLSPEEKASPFFRGYLCHLTADKVIYQVIGINEKFQEYFEKNKTGDEERNKALMKGAKDELHHDWDIINERVKENYGFTFTPEVKELGVVKFEEGELKWIAYEDIERAIESLRRLDFLNGDPDLLLEEILQ